MTAGDPIWYHQITPGGYGFGNQVPGTFLRETASRVRIRVTLKSGDSKEISVAKHNVRPRDPAAVFDSSRIQR